MVKQVLSKLFVLLFVSSVVLCNVTGGVAWADTGFDDQFTTPTLSAGWEISPGRGSYSLTANPGYLRYIIDANHVARTAPGDQNYAKALWLVRPFSGKQWTLKTAVTYNIRPGMPTNNRNMELAIYAPGGMGSPMASIYRSVGVNDNNPGSNCMCLTAGSNAQVTYFPNSPNPLPLERWYLEIERNNDHIIIKVSTDGNDSTFEYESEQTLPPGFGNDQVIEMHGMGWYGSNNPPGYADFDFIKVVPIGCITGKVTKSDGITPISGAVVKVLQSDVVKAEITTGAGGTYTLSVPSGTYKINVSHAGYITQILPRVNSGTGTTTTLDFALLSGNVIVLDEFEQASLDTNKWETHITNNGSVGIGTCTYPDETLKCVGLGTCYPGGPDSAAITSKSTVSVTMGKVVFDSRISVYEEWGNVYGDGQPRGLRVGTDPNNAIEFISTGSYGIQARTVSGGIATTTNYNFGSPRIRIIYRIEATSNQVKFFVNGNLIATHTTNIPTGAMNIYVSSHDGGAGNVPVSGDYLILGVQQSALPPAKTSPADDLALHADTSASDNGWGGGSSKSDLTDGIRTYDGEWARGLAFQKGWNQVTIDFGKTIIFDKVIAWWHDGNPTCTYSPQAYRIESWNGTSWVENFSTTNPAAYLKYPDASPTTDWWYNWSAPTENIFTPVTASKVRLWSLPKDGEVMAGYHVWLYEVEVYGSLTTVGSVTVCDASGNFLGTYTTIQAGVDACPVGGTVSALAGTYTEAVYINKRIALVGVETPTIRPPLEGAVVSFSGDSADGAYISGFRITGATGNGGYGISCTNGAEPLITNNTISGNSGHGIYCSSSSPTITNNTIIGWNSFGIYCDSSSPTITNNDISGNANDGIYCISSSSPTITNNTISRNNGQGIRCDSTSSPTITRNTISGSGNCGIDCSSSTSIITNNSISGNGEYGIICQYSSPTITNNSITGNGYEGVYCAYSSSPAITNNIITGNSTGNTAHYGIYVGSGNPIIDCNDVWGNGSPTTNNYYHCSAGAHDISVNPQFIGGGNYHLGSSSPCIDKGSNTAPGISGTSTDKDGNPRIVNGIVDMGAYEYQGAPPPQISIIFPTTGTVGSIVTVSGNGFGANESIRISLGTTATIATVISGANGTFTSTFVVDNQPAGTKTVTAFGVTSGKSAYGLFSITTPTIGPDPFVASLRVFKDGQPVNTSLLVPGETYTLETTIGNNKPYPAMGIKVAFKIYGGLGIGLPGSVVGTQSIDLGPNGSGTRSVLWTVPTSGHGCYVVEISHPDDVNLNNNRGQINMETIHTDAGGTHVNPFSVGNPTNGTATAVLSIVSVPEGWIATLDDDTLENMAPGEVRTATVRITLPQQGGSGIVRVEMRINGEYIGYIEKHVNMANISVTPGSGPTGTIITVRGIGYQPGEIVRIDFGTTNNVAQIVVNADSTFVQTFIVTGIAGTYSVRATGLTSGRTATDAFEIFMSQAIPPIKPVASYSHSPGEEFDVQVQVGSLTVPVSNLFGVSFKLNYDTTLLDVVTPYSANVTPDDMLGSDVVFIQDVDEAAGQVSIGVSRKGGSAGVSGYGNVAKIRFRVNPQAVGSSTGAFNITNVSAINSSYGSITLMPKIAGIHIIQRLTTPGLISPVDNALANQVDLNYEWTAVANAGCYRFELDNNPDFSSPEIVATSTATVYNPSSLYGPSASSLPDDRYSWRVKACGTGYADSNWSGVRGVRVTTVILNPVFGSPTKTVGQEFVVDVRVGSDTRVAHTYPANNLFAVSFSLFYDRTDILNVTTPTSAAVEAGDFLGTNTILMWNIIEDNGDGRGRVDIAISRKAGNPGVTGYGSLVKVKFTSTGTATGVTFKTSDVGHLITAYNPLGEPIDIAGWSNTMDIQPQPEVMQVWPGDTNNDGSVNEQDIFPIAIYWNTTGNARPGASLIWTGQPMPYPWTPVVATYADADGNGVVSAMDVLAIGVNYGATHTVPVSPSPSPAPAAINHAQFLEIYRAMYQVLKASGTQVPELEEALEEVIDQGVQAQQTQAPDESALMQNYPNPFNPECWIPYEIDQRAQVIIRIYNLTGQLVRTLDEGVKEAGKYLTPDRAAYWNGKNDQGDEIASGVYFYQLQIGDRVMTKRMVVLK